MSARDALWEAGVDETGALVESRQKSRYDADELTLLLVVEVNQRALIDKILARYSGEHTGEFCNHDLNIGC